MIYKLSVKNTIANLFITQHIRKIQNKCECISYITPAGPYEILGADAYLKEGRSPVMLRKQKQGLQLFGCQLLFVVRLRR